MMHTIKRFWALCLDTHMKLALYKYAIIIIIIYTYQHFLRAASGKFDPG